MTQDASFEDGREAPLRLVAFDSDDLQVISALVQDAVFPITEMKWLAGQRRFALLLNRFRWEDQSLADQRNRSYERVQSVMTIENVQKVLSQGIDRSDKDTVLSCLSVAFEPGADADGVVTITLAGDGAIAVHVEALEAVLRDVTKPYVAPSGKAPDHPE
ncbi:DUF2948 family protein [Parasulfitobacter algicola]|uniref:DUF2948 family protein n=1 Tax=Parasulfitobacter algicola TaxID=2614809 RepID=A0ABX2IZ43_9RHOB|nr:DUF2948 family protein [Sulfitobacter algicola]NSX56620.1 DUF2948 family protein [Sulfitobacter algicola]